MRELTAENLDAMGRVAETGTPLVIRGDEALALIDLARTGLFPGCHLPLVALKRGESCPQCRKRAVEHRNWTEKNR